VKPLIPLNADDFFDLPRSLSVFAPFFSAEDRPWGWIKAIAPALAAQPRPLATAPGPILPPGVHVEGEVYLHPSVKLPASATIIGPAWIGANTELRPGAYLRGNVIVGENCVLGNSCEFKNCLLMDAVQVPHFS